MSDAAYYKAMASAKHAGEVEAAKVQERVLAAGGLSPADWAKSSIPVLKVTASTKDLGLEGSYPKELYYTVALNLKSGPEKLHKSKTVKLSSAPAAGELVEWEPARIPLWRVSDPLVSPLSEAALPTYADVDCVRVEVHAVTDGGETDEVCGVMYTSFGVLSARGMYELSPRGNFRVAEGYISLRAVESTLPERRREAEYARYGRLVLAKANVSAGDDAGRAGSAPVAVPGSGGGGGGGGDAREPFLGDGDKKEDLVGLFDIGSPALELASLKLK